MSAAGEPDGASRVVFASTVVTGDAGGRLLTEDEPLPVATPYGRAKQEGERLLLDSGLNVGRSCGPRTSTGREAGTRRSFSRGCASRALRGRRRWKTWDVVHVDDVAAALRARSVGAGPGPGLPRGRREPIAYCDFMALSAHALGVGLRAGSRRRSRGCRGPQRGRRGRPLGAVLERKIRRELGWRPRYATASEGVPRGRERRSRAAVTRCSHPRARRARQGRAGPSAPPASSAMMPGDRQRRCRGG